ncbi:MAG: hypothetical protein C4340_04810 [Armatimonadota bacterium]
MKKSRLWGHAFEAHPDPKAWKFSQSIGTDLNLLREELEVSLAHVRMLGRQGILLKEDASALVAALESLVEEAAVEAAQERRGHPRSCRNGVSKAGRGRRGQIAHCTQSQ